MEIPTKTIISHCALRMALKRRGIIEYKTTFLKLPKVHKKETIEDGVFLMPITIIFAIMLSNKLHRKQMLHNTPNRLFLMVNHVCQKSSQHG